MHLTPSEHEKYDEFNDLLNDQRKIGWNHLLQGNFLEKIKLELNQHFSGKAFF